jgi:DNA-binding CsgD family transcriptional regulator
MVSEIERFGVMKKAANQVAQKGDLAISQGQTQPASPRLQNTLKLKRFLAHGFVIWEIPTRKVRFCVPADGDGDIPEERVAGMLAMHCLALRRRLEDFEVLVLTHHGLPSTVAERARQLIAAGRSIVKSAKLSALEEAILDSVIQNLQNKEIAEKLSIPVCTVKSVVSSLLAKFNVPNRTALGRQFWMPSHR